MLLCFYWVQLIQLNTWLSLFHFVDSDECIGSHLNNCTQECINTIGSYTCECKNGFTKVDRLSCKG